MVPGSAPQQGYDPRDLLPLTKTCSKCKVTKMSDDFFRDKSKPDGMYSQVLAPRLTSAIILCASDHVQAAALRLGVAGNEPETV